MGLTDTPAVAMRSEILPFEWQRTQRAGWSIADRVQLIGTPGDDGLGKKKRTNRRALIRNTNTNAVNVSPNVSTVVNVPGGGQLPANRDDAGAPGADDAAEARYPSPAPRASRYSSGPNLYDPEADAAEAEAAATMTADEAYEGQAGYYAQQGVGFLPLIAAGASLFSSLFKKKPKPPAPPPQPAQSKPTESPASGSSASMGTVLPLVLIAGVAIFAMTRSNK